MSNMIAQAALLIWPIVSLIMFMMMPAWRATIWTILGGYLLLPISTAFDFPGIPPLDKMSIPNLVALALAPIMARSGEFQWPRSRTVNCLILAYVLLPFATAYTNPEPIYIGRVVLPGLGFREGLSAAIGNALEVVPFLLGAAMLGTAARHRELLLALVVAALAYSLPILAEVRLSPFLQSWVYGVNDAGAFLQQMRSGGFRSMVFLGHGLLVSTFLAMALVSAAGLARTRVRVFSLPMGAITAYLAILLLLNKSVGAVVLAAVLIPALLFLRSRRFLTVALALAMLVFVYPIVRGAGLVPIETVTQAAASISQERAESLQFRLDNERILLDRADKKPLFGWGAYGRNRIVVLTDWGETRDVSVTDGSWIILLGIGGWIGYLACFGLLCYPALRAFRYRRLDVPIVSLTLLAAHILNILDLLPNSSLQPVTWLIAGALASMSVRRQRSDSNGLPGSGEVRVSGIS
ncbi:MAG: hypothetical protein J0I80_15445 [Sphingomonas sp.]|nr:hypothetical protein [Sphingomonas sp.]